MSLSTCRPYRERRGQRERGVRACRPPETRWSAAWRTTEAAFSSAERVTLVGSTMPAGDHVAVLFACRRRSRSRPCRQLLTFSSTTEPSMPALAAIWLHGLGQGPWRRCWTPVFSSPSSWYRPACVNSGHGVDIGGAAAGHDALFHSGAGGVQSVLDAQLLLLHLSLGGGADLDDGHTAGQLGQTLLQLLLVILGGGGLDLTADLSHAGLDVLSWRQRRPR